MSMPPQLLAATDLSPGAGEAIERAAQLCLDLDGRLELFHAVNPAPLERLRQLLREAPADLPEQLLDAARRRLRAQGDALLQRYGLSAGTRVAAGALPAALAEHTDATATDLLVCGTSNEGFARNLLLGSTAERILDRIRCSLLVVKQRATFAYRRLLVPVDFSAVSLRAIVQARRFVPAGDITLLHVFEVPFEGFLRYASVEEDIIERYRSLARQEAMQQLQELAQTAGLPLEQTRLMVLEGEPVLRILEQEPACDLIVMGQHGDQGLERLLLGSVCKRMLAESRGDLLVAA